ncbi:MAG: ABC transporter substrate-binding protein [Candidatus Brocadiae bacterium]|nr:ABC transporter substrate-binding protein [Candidatus Brocadiia bacterium]
MSYFLISLISLVLFLFCACDFQQSYPKKEAKNPGNSPFHEQLEKEISFARGESQPGNWPRTIVLDHTTRKWNTGESILEKRKFTIPAKPMRVVSHAVGITEILWAILPRERILGFHESCASSENSALSKEFKERGPFFSGAQTEQVIAWKPDVVFVVSYSDQTFQKALWNAGIFTLDLGYTGDWSGLKKQILFLGECLGEEGNAKKLIQTIEKYTSELSHKFSHLKGIRVLDYSSFDTVSGQDSTFQILCDILGLANIGKEQEIQGFKTVEAEWILKQNPQAIVFCAYPVKQKLEKNPLLRELQCVKMGHLVYMESQYLSSISQYMIAAANQLAERLNALYFKKP